MIQAFAGNDGRILMIFNLTTATGESDSVNNEESAANSILIAEANLPRNSFTKTSCCGVDVLYDYPPAI